MFNQGNKMSAKQTLFFTAEAATGGSHKQYGNGNVLQYKNKGGTTQQSVLSTKNKAGLSMLVSPCWSQDSQDQSWLAWQPAPSQYPHRNTGKPDQTPPGLRASPAAMSLEHWALKRNKTQLLINALHKLYHMTDSGKTVYFPKSISLTWTVDF